MTLLLTTDFVAETQSRVSTRPRIRRFDEKDLDAVAELYQRVAGHPLASSAEMLRRIFLEMPWRDGSVSSLVCEDAGGRLIGCLGLMPRPMSFCGRAILAVIGHHFVVEHSPQGMRAGVELARRFLRGPQDVALAVGNEFSRRIWSFAGGSVSALHSFSWTRALRPAQYALSFLKHRGLPAPAAATLNPACQAVDATLNLIAQRAFPLKAPASLSDDLDAVTLFACLSAFAGDRSLQPSYDTSSLAWLVETLALANHGSHLHKIAVRTESGRPLGWYLYYLGPSGVAEVLQIGGRDETMGEVLHHLFYHARQRGAVAVTGPMDARLLAVLSENQCLFHGPANFWTLFHSRDPRIVDAIHAGDAFLSRLETDWWTTT